MCVRYVARSGWAGVRRWKTCMMILEILISRERRPYLRNHNIRTQIATYPTMIFPFDFCSALVVLYEAIVDLSRALLFCLTLAVRLQSQHKTQHNLPPSSTMSYHERQITNYLISILFDRRQSFILMFPFSVVSRCSLYLTLSRVESLLRFFRVFYIVRKEPLKQCKKARTHHAI